MSCVAQIKILEIHQKEIFPGEISVTISGCESGFWCWTQSQVTTSHHSCVLVEHSFPCTNGKSTEEQKKNTESDFIESVSFERLSDYLTFVRLQYPAYQHATAQSRSSPG